MEAIGQTLNEGGIAVEERPADRALSYRERQAIRAQRLQPVYNEAVRLKREAESDRDAALDALGTAATRFLLGDASEAEVEEVERAAEDAERRLRRWTAAMRTLDDERGVIRDAAGNRL